MKERTSMKEVQNFEWNKIDLRTILWFLICLAKICYLRFWFARFSFFPVTHTTSYIRSETLCFEEKNGTSRVSHVQLFEFWKPFIFFNIDFCLTKQELDIPQLSSYKRLLMLWNKQITFVSYPELWNYTRSVHDRVGFLCYW